MLNLEPGGCWICSKLQEFKPCSQAKLGISQSESCWFSELGKSCICQFDLPERTITILENLERNTAKEKKTLVQAKTTLSDAFQVKQFCLVRFLPVFTLDSTNSMDFRSPDLQISAIARCISSSQPTGVCPTWISLGYVKLMTLGISGHDAVPSQILFFSVNPEILRGESSAQLGPQPLTPWAAMILWQTISCAGKLPANCLPFARGFVKTKR